MALPHEWLDRVCELTGTTSGEALQMVMSLRKKSRNADRPIEDAIAVLEQMAEEGIDLKGPRVFDEWSNRYSRSSDGGGTAAKPTEDSQRLPKTAKLEPLDPRLVSATQDLMTSLGSHTSTLAVERFLHQLGRAVPEIKELSTSEVVTALAQVAGTGDLSIDSTIAFFDAREPAERRGYKVSGWGHRSTKSDRNPLGRSRRPRRNRGAEGRAVRADDFERCPHGVPKIHLCAICDPEKYRELMDYD